MHLDDANIAHNVTKRNYDESRKDMTTRVKDRILANGWQLLETPPIFNNRTIFACVMCPSMGIYQCQRAKKVQYEVNSTTTLLDRLVM